MPRFRYVFADVFTDTPLEGNQLAVFTDGRDIDDAAMQAIALEIGFSESVFVFRPESGGTVKIRIFTPYFESFSCAAAFVVGDIHVSPSMDWA